MRIETPKGNTIKTATGEAFLNWDPVFQPKWERRYAKAQVLIDSEVLRASNPYMPMQSGMLQKSGIHGTILGGGEVLYNAPYARYQYYGKVMVGRAPKQLTDKDIVYHGGPKRGAFWFERMKAEHKEIILRRAAKLMED